LTVVTLDVDDTNLGSEMSYLLMDLLRLAGMVPWLWNPGVVGVLATELTGEGCAKVGVELPEERKVVRGGLGEGAGSRMSLVWMGWGLCDSK
jgi:hypothetical protein